MSFSFSSIAKTSTMMAAAAQSADKNTSMTALKSGNSGSAFYSPEKMAADTVTQGVEVVLGWTEKSDLGLNNTALNALFALGFMTAQKQAGLGVSQSGFIIDLKV